MAHPGWCPSANGAAEPPHSGQAPYDFVGLRPPHWCFSSNRLSSAFKARSRANSRSLVSLLPLDRAARGAPTDGCAAGCANAGSRAMTHLFAKLVQTQSSASPARPASGGHLTISGKTPEGHASRSCPAPVRLLQWAKRGSVPNTPWQSESRCLPSRPGSRAIRQKGNRGHGSWTQAPCICTTGLGQGVRAVSALMGCAKCEREPRGRRGSRAHGRLRRRRYPRILSVGSERPPQAAQMTKAGAGVVKAGARMRGNALARRRRSARSRRRRRRRPCLAGPTHRAGGKRS